MIFFTSTLKGEDFITCKMWGQLGNQLFMIATTLGLAWDNGATPVFPDLEKETNWNVPHNHKFVFFRLDSKKPPGVVFREKKLNHYKKIKYEKNIILGPFSLKKEYFEHYTERLRELFAPPKSIENYIQKHYQKVLNASNTVGVQIRASCCSNLPFSGWDYYGRAMRLFPEDSLFIICSDRISWVKKHFPSDIKNVLFIEEDDYLIDFFLLSKCKNNIFGASTFGYWSAFLNSNPDKKVVCPSLWLGKNNKRTKQGFPAKFSVYPEDWIVLDVPLNRSVPKDVKQHSTFSTDW